MQDNENLSEPEPTATDETVGGGPESTAPEQHETAELHHSNEEESQDETASLESAELVEEDEDDGPVELDDPFSGSENAYWPEPIPKECPVYTMRISWPQAVGTICIQSNYHAC